MYVAYSISTQLDYRIAGNFVGENVHELQVIRKNIIRECLVFFC